MDARGSEGIRGFPRTGIGTDVHKPFLIIRKSRIKKKFSFSLKTGKVTTDQFGFHVSEHFGGFSLVKMTPNGHDGIFFTLFAITVFQRNLQAVRFLTFSNFSILSTTRSVFNSVDRYSVKKFKPKVSINFTTLSICTPSCLYSQLVSFFTFWFFPISLTTRSIRNSVNCYSIKKLKSIFTLNVQNFRTIWPQHHEKSSIALFFPCFLHLQRQNFQTPGKNYLLNQSTCRFEFKVTINFTTLSTCTPSCRYSQLVRFLTFWFFSVSLTTRSIRNPVDCYSVKRLKSIFTLDVQNFGTI